MYLRQLTLENLKLIQRLELDFMRGDEPRRWTVLLGENGTCKTTVLQAIAILSSGETLGRALSAVGASDGGSDFLRALSTHASSNRPDVPLQIAKFGFGQLGHAGLPPRPELSQRRYPQLPESDSRPISPPILTSSVGGPFSGAAEGLLAWTSEYIDPIRHRGLEDLTTGEERFQRLKALTSVLDFVREPDSPLPHWFVAGYGVGRNLPLPQTGSDLPAVQDRLQSLFGHHSIRATNFPDYFRLSGQDALARIHQDTLNKLLALNADLLPDIEHIDLGLEPNGKPRGRNERHRVTMNVDGHPVTVRTTDLSQGYQSSLAWISDLIGQLLLEVGEAVPVEEMEGLVLVDELDLHLHPRWQVSIKRALEQVFPRLQFIVTTHSPLVISGCAPDEVIRLKLQDGAVVQDTSPAPDPREMTAAELVWHYFGQERLIVNPIGEKLHEYRRLARNAFRGPQQQATLEALRVELGDRVADVEVLPREAE